MTFRQQQSLETRRDAAELADQRPHPRHRSNGDERRLRGESDHPSYAGNFTKCLPHDNHGFLLEPRDYEEWARAIDSGDPRDFRRLRIGPGPFQPNGDFVYTSADTPQLDWVATYTTLAGDPGVRA